MEVLFGDGLLPSLLAVARRADSFPRRRLSQGNYKKLNWF